MMQIDHPLLSRQRNTFDVDNIRAYALRVRKYLRDGDHIVDIGCGFGFVDVALAELVKARFTLLDKTGDEQRQTFSPRGYAHNDLDITRQVTATIGAEVMDIAKYGWEGPADVVLSTLSWGWHYPLSLYRDRVMAMKPRAIIVDLREAQVIPGYRAIDAFTINRKETTMVFRRSR